MKRPASAAAEPSPHCKNRCGRRVQTKRSKLCLICFGRNAARSGAQSAGNANAKGNAGNAGNTSAKGIPDNAGNTSAKGIPGNAGNTSAKGIPDNAGNTKGNPDNAGNTSAKGIPDNAGNERKGPVKIRAGRRSGLKRSAKYALVVKKQWLDLILAGKKNWEIRGCSTKRRGWIHFAESQAGGKLAGRARLVDCLPVTKSMFAKHFSNHHVRSWSAMPYKHVYAWVLEQAERFTIPFGYDHQQGAVIWVKTQ
jgi:hypothetical protein